MPTFPPTICDFCGEGMTPIAFNDRTCPACFANGAPRQTDPAYDAAHADWLKRQRSRARINVHNRNRHAREKRGL